MNQQTIDMGIVYPHETYHIWPHKDIKDKLYNLLGYYKIPGGLKFPTELIPRRFTNPDCPEIEHAIKLNYKGEDIWWAFITFVGAEKY